MKIRHSIPAAALLFGMAACTPEQIFQLIDGRIVESSCAEDESCWDCPTMGNQECGPEAPAWMQDGDPTTGPVSE